MDQSTRFLFAKEQKPNFEFQLAETMRLLDPDQSDADVHKVLEAQKDYGAFMRRMYPNYTEGHHLDLLRGKLDAVTAGEIKRLIITMPPRHSKTFHVSEGYPAFRLGQDPDMRVMAVSHTQSLANKNSNIVRQHINSNLWPFPEVSVSKARGGIQSWDIAGSMSGGYVPIGVSGSPTGLGFDLLVIDDPIRSQKDAKSELIRDTLWDWYNGTIYTRRQPGAAIIVTSTRWHEDDLTGRLLKRMEEGGEQWDHLYLPALDGDGNYLWPEFWSDEEYEMARMQSDRVWTTQYMGRPSAEEGEMLREEWFPDAEIGTQYETILQSWDCAAETGDNNDYSVGVTIGVSINGFDILHVSRDKVDMPDLVELIKRDASWAAAQWPNARYRLVIEDKYPGKSAIQILERSTRLPITRYNAPAGEDKETRVIDVTPLAKGRKIRISPGMRWRTELMAEFTSFPFGAHDDIVDASMIGIIEAAGFRDRSPQMKSKSYATRGKEPEMTRDGSALYRKPRGPRKPGKRR